MKDLLEPILRSRLLSTRAMVLLKNRLFHVAHVVYMSLDSLEGIEKPPSIKNYCIRTYRKGDEAIWTNLIERSFAHLRPGDVSTICKSDNFDPEGFFFLEHHDETIGTVYAETVTEGNSKSGKIVALCIVPDYQGKKLGYLLLRYALNYLKDKGLKSVLLDVDEFNKAAVKTYLSVGFKFVNGYAD